MKKLLNSLLPLVPGALAFWLFFSPPEVLTQSLGPWTFPASLLFVAIFLVAWLYVILLRGFPRTVKVATADLDSVDAHMKAIIAELEQLGFRALEGPLAVGSPPATLVGLIAPDGLCYANVFRTGTVPAKTAWDFTSTIDLVPAPGYSFGGLTSGSLRSQGTMTTGPGHFKQIFPGAGIAAVYEHHQAAVAHLTQQRIPVRRAYPASYPSEVKTALEEQRKTLMAPPFLEPFRFIVRTALGTCPFVGPIAEQPAARTKMERLAKLARTS
ncbi:MAG: hypothetical protein AAGF12_08590 [Myxococcota bacterium]